jgi:hypothetical protein
MFADSIDFIESTYIRILQPQSDWKIHEIEETLLFFIIHATL